jgi:hypothetical protein
MAMVAAVNGGGPQKGGLSKMVAETTANKKATTNSNNMGISFFLLTF